MNNSQTITSEEYQALISKRGNKYHARRVQMDGCTFDSQAEADRYLALKCAADEGRIERLKVHPRFRLEVNRVHICDYEADFTYWQDGKLVVEDVKSAVTKKLPTYRLKKKLLFALHGIEIVEIGV